MLALHFGRMVVDGMLSSNSCVVEETGKPLCCNRALLDGATAVTSRNYLLFMVAVAGSIAVELSTLCVELSGDGRTGEEGFLSRLRRRMLEARSASVFPAEAVLGPR